MGMSRQHRNDAGRFGEKMRDQDILKAFDFEATADEPYLMVSEVTDALARHWEIDVSEEAVRQRLADMVEREVVARREFGPSVAYRALVAPRLAEDVQVESDERRETPRDEFVALDEP